MLRMLGVLVVGLGALASCSLVTDLDGYAGGAGDSAADGGGLSAEASTPPPSGDASTPDVDAGPTYRDAVLADAPIAYWPLDEAAGALVAKDVAGKHDATLGGSATFGASGVSGAALQIATAGPSLEVAGTIEFTGEAPYAFECWAVPTYTDAFQNVFDRRDNGLGYVLYFRQEGAVQLEQNWAGGTRGGWFDLTKSKAFVHVVASFDGTTFRLYVDGVPSTHTYQAAGGPPSLSLPLTIGGNFEGVLDELAIYDHALPPERVALHHQLGAKK